VAVEGIAIPGLGVKAGTRDNGAEILEVESGGPAELAGLHVTDVINAGTGNDTVTYRGTEVSIDGNSGTDKLVLAAAGGITAINLSISTDQTTGDTVTVSISPYDLTKGRITFRFK